MLENAGMAKTAWTTIKMLVNFFLTKQIQIPQMGKIYGQAALTIVSLSYQAMMLMPDCLV
jgi:hypothetical protein